MPIARAGKYLETEDLGITHSLGIESSQLSECIEEINHRNIQGVFGSPVFGFIENNLDFFKKLHEIRQAWLWEISLKDVSGLYSQSELEYLGVFPKRPGIDFAQFKKLRTMVWQPVKNDAGLEKLENLASLDIWRYKSKNMTFNGLALPKSLRKLELNWCGQNEIDTLPCLPALEELQIHYCRNLNSLKGIGRLAPRLKKLVVTRCANLESFEEAQEMNLEHIYINVKGKVVAN
jgi:hypothetical protein